MGGPDIGAQELARWEQEVVQVCQALGVVLARTLASAVAAGQHGGTARVLVLIPEAAAKLRELRARQEAERAAVGAAWTEQGAVFATYGGTFLEPRWINRYVDGVIKRQGWPDRRMRVHEFRHSLVAALLARGTSMQLVSELIGHASQRTTADIYANKLQGNAKQTADETAEVVRQARAKSRRRRRRVTEPREGDAPMIRPNDTIPALGTPQPAATRPCGRCARVLPLDAYSWKRRADGLRHSVCPECQRAVARGHYQANAGAYKARAAERNAAARGQARAALTDYLARHGCARCGVERNLLGLVTLRGELRNASDLVRAGVAWPRLAALLAQGVVLCRGCDALAPTGRSLPALFAARGHVSAAVTVARYVKTT